MPHEKTVSVLHYADGRLWFDSEVRSEPTYDELVVARARAIANEVSDVDTWGAPLAEHERDECVECDALRLLDQTASDLYDDVSLDVVQMKLELLATGGP